MKNKTNKPEYTDSGNMPIKAEKLLDKLFKTRRNSAEDQEERNLKLEKMRLIKKYFGWKNEDIAKLLKTTPQTVKSRLSPSSKQNLPIWVDAFIAMFETLKPGTLARIQAAEDRNKPTAIFIDESQFLPTGGLETRGDGSSVWFTHEENAKKYKESTEGQYFVLATMEGNQKYYLDHVEGDKAWLCFDPNISPQFKTPEAAKEFAKEKKLHGSWFVE